jgi:hypothetical protein
MTWTAHIDTDEYMAVHPFMLTQKSKFSAIPKTPSAGSLYLYWKKMFRRHSKLMGSKTCLLMPSLLFGSRELGDQKGIGGGAKVTPLTHSCLWNQTTFETLRWNFHGEFAERPKSFVDVSTIPDNHKIFQEGRAWCPHIPLFRSHATVDCPPNQQYFYNATMSSIENNDIDRSLLLSRPLSVNHYLGSLERYLFRSDARRNENVYRKQAAIGDGFQDNGWVMGWLDNFVEQHGIGKASQVLFHNLVTYNVSEGSQLPNGKRKGLCKLEQTIVSDLNKV